MSHRTEVDNILSAAPKPLKQSQEEPEPSDVNDTLSYFFFTIPISTVISSQLVPCSSCQAYLSLFMSWLILGLNSFHLAEEMGQTVSIRAVLPPVTGELGDDVK